MDNKTFTALTIAGSDSGGGAGIQADLKTFMSYNVYGSSVITAITAQNTQRVEGIHIIPAEMVEAQINAVITDIGANAVKTGMLGNRDIITAVIKCLNAHGAENLVADPVMVSTSGHRLLNEDAIDLYRSELLPFALLVTPNLQEAEILAGQAIDSPKKLRDAALRILNLGPKWVLIKGGHRKFDEDKNTVIDLLTDGVVFENIKNARINTVCTHGTGCTLSAAIAAGLARGMELPGAVMSAEKYLNYALNTAMPVGKGRGPVNHNHGIPVI